MFSGIVDHCGELVSIEKRSASLQFWIAHQFTETLNLGDSVAVDGACLTIVDFKKGQFAFELSPDTLRVTTAKEYQPGQSLNLELAMLLSDRVGGHLVTGHVEQTIVVSSINVIPDSSPNLISDSALNVIPDLIRDPEYQFTEVHFSNIPKEAQRFLVKKGSVTINGVSLTINDVYDNGFGIMLIPHTLERTNLSDLKVGQPVNVEWDCMVKMVDRQVFYYLSEGSGSRIKPGMTLGGESGMTLSAESGVT